MDEELSQRCYLIMKPTPQQIETGARAAWGIFSPDDEWESRHFYSQKCKTVDAVEAALIAVFASRDEQKSEPTS